jgi:hypothetical protein
MSFAGCETSSHDPSDAGRILRTERLRCNDELDESFGRIGIAGLVWFGVGSKRGDQIVQERERENDIAVNDMFAPVPH